MKHYLFEIHVTDVDQKLDFFHVLLDCMLGILQAFAVEVVVAGVTEEKETEDAG